MATTLAPDDDVFRFRQVWLGPAGHTLLWHASYVAYLLFAVYFALLAAIYAVTPLTMPMPPVVEVIFTAAAVTVTLSGVDYDKPVRAIVTTVARALITPTPADPAACTRPRSRVKITRTPL